MKYVCRKCKKESITTTDTVYKNCPCGGDIKPRNNMTTKQKIGAVILTLLFLHFLGMAGTADLEFETYKVEQR